MARRLLLDSLWVFSTRVLMRVANFLVLIILARALSLDAFGTYGLAISTLLMLSFMLDLGTRQSSAVEIAKTETPETFATHLLALSLIISLMAVLVTALMMRAIMMPPEDIVIALVALTAFPIMILRCVQGIQLGLGRLDQLNLSELLPRLLMLPALAILWWVDWLSLEAALIAMLVGHLIGALYLVAVSSPMIRFRARLQASIFLTLLRHGMAFAGGAIAMILLGRVSIWIIGALSGPADVGVFFAMTRLSELPVEVAGAIGVALFSHGVRRTAGASNGADTARVVRSVNFLLLLGAVLMAWWAEPLLRLSFGPEFVAYAGLLQIMLAGAVLSCMSMMLYPCLASNGRARVGLWAYGPGTIAAAALTWLLVPAFGVYGAAIAVLIAKTWAVVVLVVGFVRTFEISPWALILPSLEDFRPVVAMISTKISGRRLGSIVKPNRDRPSSPMTATDADGAERISA